MLKQEVTRISDRTWCISEFRLVNTFLVEGEEKAAMIDTDCGLGNIREIASSITSRPLSVLLTHSHSDHVGGIYEFKDCPIYMSSRDTDEKIFGMETDNTFRRMYVETRGKAWFPGHEEELLSLIPEEEPDCSFDFADIDDGSFIDLGHRVLECILSPGHTKGSICYLDKITRILFSGDTVNNSIILARQPADGTALIESYRKTLQKLWNREKEFDALAIGHGSAPIDKDIIYDYLCLCNGLLDGSLKGRYEERGFRRGDVARLGRAELWYQCDN